MSLINDALKRAKHAQQRSAPPSAPSPTLRPVELAQRKPSNISILLPLALVVLVSVGGIILWLAISAGGARLSSTTVAQARSVSTLAPAATATSPTLTAVRGEPDVQPSLQVVAATFPIISGSEQVPTSSQNQSSSAQPITAPASPELTAMPTQAVVMVNGPPPPPPLPKLQGILFRPERPVALLDGKMVLVGRSSGDYRVVGISQQSVTVVRGGETNVLEMPD